MLKNFIEEQKALLKQTLLTPTFMMCAPTHFDPSFEAHGGEVENDFMGDKIDPAKAEAQWHAFKDTLTNLGAKIILVAPKEGQLDQVYTADPAAFHSEVTFNGAGDNIERIHFKSLMCQFTNAGRQAESSAHFIASAEFIHRLRDMAHGTSTSIGATSERAQYNTEGSGDNVYDTYRGIWWSGYAKNPNDPKNGRSDIKAHAQLTKLTGRDVLSLEVVKPYFHIDTSHTPLPGGHVLSFKDGITPDAHDLMRRVALADFGLPEDDYLINVSKEDAEAFACNLTAVNDKDLIVAHDISDKLESKLVNAGYNPHRIDYSEIRKGGGLFHCTANRINMIGPKGGTANDPGFYDRIESALG